jgi:hypothetical protein
MDLRIKFVVKQNQLQLSEEYPVVAPILQMN